jgi:hypothetical protein
MISLNTPAFSSLNQEKESASNERKTNCFKLAQHKYWNQDNGWKNALNNLRLIIQPLLLLCLIYPWLDIFPCANLLIGFNQLIAETNRFQSLYCSA